MLLKHLVIKRRSNGTVIIICPLPLSLKLGMQHESDYNLSLHDAKLLILPHSVSLQ